LSEPVEVKNRGIITLCVMAATVMQVLDTTIANVALPHMQGSLSAAQDTITWVLTSYIVAAAVATPLSGWLADRFGRKRLFLISVGGFTIASMLCGSAMSLGEMVTFRVFQGIFGAALIPLSQAVMLDINPRERHAQAMAIWGAGIMIGPILGPALGGYLTDTLSWRWVFFVNLPIGVLVFLGLLFLMAPNRPQVRNFDFLGFSLLAIAVAALQFMLDRGEQKDWFGSVEIWAELFISIGAFWMFGVHLATSKHAFIDRRLLLDRNLMSSLCLIFVVGAVVVGVAALVPPMLQNLFGYSTVESGLVLAPRGGGTLVMMLLLGRFGKHFDPRLLLLMGLAITVGAMWWMTRFTIVMGWLPFVTNGILQGFGLGLLFGPLTALSLSTVDAQLRNQAASLFSLMRNVGSSVGVSILATELAQNTQINHAQLVEHINPFNPAMMPQLSGIAAAVAAPFAAFVPALLNQEVTRQAAMIAYINDFKLVMWMALASFPFILILRAPKRQPTAPAAPSAAASQIPADVPH